MNILYLIIFFILGLHMGSFLTVIGLRLPKKENFTTTRSHCDSCGHILGATKMIPILSYIFQKGRCRHCGAKVDVLSTYVEFFTGALFAVAFYAFGFSYELLIALGIVSLLTIVVVSDITYLIIPDEVLVFFSVYFLIIQTLNIGLLGAGKQLLSGLFLFGVMYLIMILGNKMLKKESLGGGDIKMMAFVSMIIGWKLSIVVVFLASFIALPLSIINMYRKNEHMLPFGPYLAIAALILVIGKIDFNMLLNLLQ